MESWDQALPSYVRAANNPTSIVLKPTRLPRHPHAATVPPSEGIAFRTGKKSPVMSGQVLVSSELARP